MSEAVRDRALGEFIGLVRCGRNRDSAGCSSVVGIVALRDGYNR